MSETPQAPSLGRRIARIALRALLVLVALVVCFAGFVFWKSERGMNQRMEVAGEPLTIPTDAESIARGERLANLRGCMECHGADGGGASPIDAMPVMRIHTPSITRKGPTANYTGQDWTRAVRHGVRPDGSVLLFMPVGDFRSLDDADLGAIVAYLRSLPEVDHQKPRLEVGPVGRLLYVTGELPLVVAELVDHSTPVAAAPPVGPTVEYGRYLAESCTGCHGPNLSGGKIPGTPPEWPPAANLTPHATGLAGMTDAQFVAAVTQGKTRDGRTIDPMFMPWRQFARFTPDEVAALRAYLGTLPARPAGGR